MYPPAARHSGVADFMARAIMSLSAARHSGVTEIMSRDCISTPAADLARHRLTREVRDVLTRACGVGGKLCRGGGADETQG